MYLRNLAQLADVPMALLAECPEAVIELLGEAAVARDRFVVQGRMDRKT